MQMLLILLSYGLKPGWLLYIFMFWIFNQVENNFSWSLPLSTIKMTSKCTKLKWNQELWVSGFIEKFWTFWGGLISMEFFFTITSQVNKVIMIMIIIIIINIHFHWNLSGNHVCKKKNKLCHHHIIFTACTLISHGSWPICTRNPFLRFW